MSAGGANGPGLEALNELLNGHIVQGRRLSIQSKMIKQNHPVLEGCRVDSHCVRE